MRSTVRISGLDTFVNNVRKLDPNAAKELRKGLRLSGAFLVKTTRIKIPKRTGKAARSITTRSTQRSVSIIYGGDRAPYYPWLDFGGKTGIRDSVVRPFVKEGRYIYPTLKKMRPEIEGILTLALRKAARDSGLDVDS